MVQVIYGEPHGNYAGPRVAGAGPTALMHIHAVERHIHGNSVKVHVYGEIKIASHQYVYAKELKLNTLEMLQLTPEKNVNDTHGYIANKFIYHKGELDNYASIDVYDDAGEDQTPGVGPVDGSIWLDFEALGE